MLPQNPKSSLSESKTFKTPNINIWNICISYVFGNQNVAWSATERRFIFPDNREKTFNLLLNMYRNVVSRLAVAYPNIAVSPASPSYDDILKSKASEQALKYIWQEQSLEKKYQLLAQWLVICGSAGLYCYYDPNKDDICVEVVSPYDLFYEQYAQSPSESAWVAVRSYVNRQAAMDAYPEHAEMIKELPNANRDYTIINSQGTSTPKETVELFHVYGTENDYGVVIGDQYVWKGSFPEGVTEPVLLVKYTDIPQLLWGLGMVFPLLDAQNEYNKIQNNIIQNVELFSNPKWLIPKTSGVSANSITDRPGEKIFYNAAGGAPTPVKMPELPSFVQNTLIQIQNEMYDISGIHSISLGKKVTGITSGKAIENLSSLDSSQLQMTQNNIESATRTLAKNILLYMKAYYKEGKYLRMFDKFGRFVYTEIDTTQFADDPEVFIEAGTFFQDDIANRENRIMQQLQMGLLTPEEAKEQLNFRTVNRNAIEELANISKAKKLLGQVALGNQIEIYLDDDLEVFKKIFKEFINDEEVFYALSEERQNYISDIYKAILSAITNSKQAMAQGLQPSHTSIIKPPANAKDVEKITFAYDSDEMLGQVADKTVDAAGKMQEINTLKNDVENMGMSQPV